MAKPQSCVVFGNFGLGGGRRVSTPPDAGPGQKQTYHCHYNTVLQTTDHGPDRRNSLPAQLRVYSPKDDVPLDDDTVVFAIARAYIPPNGPVLLDAINIYPYPGDPSDEAYDDRLPSFPLYLTALGSVTSVLPVTALENDRRVVLEVGDRVRDERKQCSIEAMFSWTTPRWHSVPIPAKRSITQILGICHAIRPDGMLTVEVENLTLNAMPLPADGGNTVGPAGPPVTSPGKKRKYSAYVSPPCAPPASNPEPTSPVRQTAVPPVASGSGRSPDDAAPPVVGSGVLSTESADNHNSEIDRSALDNSLPSAKGKKKAQSRV